MIRDPKSEFPPRGRAKWRQLGPNHVGEASLEHFADDLGIAARHYPKRFAALALRFPCTIDSRYFTTLIRELTPTTPPNDDIKEWGPASIPELESIIEHAGALNSNDYVQAVCRAVYQREDGSWSDGVIDKLISYTSHPHPQQDEFTNRSQDAKNAMGPDIEGTALNCARGAAAAAITALLWRYPDKFDQLLAATARLLSDSHPSVRSAALSALLPIWNRDRASAVRLLVNACGHEDDRILGSHWLNEFIPYARKDYLTDILPIVERMISSSHEKVAESGAAWITAFWLDGYDVQRLFDCCRTENKPRRLGIADTVSEYIAHGSAMEKAGPILKQMFDDVEPDVRSRAAVIFRWNNALGIEGMPTLALAFVASQAYKDDPGNLLHPLSDYTGSIQPYAEVILRAGEVLASSLAEDTRSIRQRNAFAGNELSQVLISLYEIAYNSRDTGLQNRCLDCWDLLLQHRVGMTEDHLRLLDD